MFTKQPILLLVQRSMKIPILREKSIKYNHPIIDTVDMIGTETVMKLHCT